MNFPGYISEVEASARLGAAVKTLRTWASRRQGPPRVKVGRTVLYREESLAAWLASRETDPAAARRVIN